ncbi:MAG TPA: hypothetical protein PKC76_04670 [Saprospiraceae bacterium]|nr:hypothetical protein [Saprospiraceae bacterium]HMP23399.1 hypothetical protein [Saprospiraceae bacterium]
MKKLLLILLAVIVASGAIYAQNGKKDLSTAKKALGSFSLDPINNKAKLKEAVNAVDAALTDPEMQASADAWNKKGEIYNEIASQRITISQIGIGSIDDLPKVDGNPAVIASAAFRAGLEKAQKKFETKDALKGLQAVQGNLNNLGFFDYEEQKYANAFLAFKEALEIHDILVSNKENSALASEDDYNNQLYIIGLAALNSKQTGEAKAFFQQLYEAKFDKPAIYEALYQIAADEDGPEAAYSYLEAGRNQYPDDISLLFAEINHYLKLGKLEVLTGKLEMAIQQEPDNVSLYTTTGSVYDNLHQRSFSEGDTKKADEYFAKAKEYYEMALKKSPNNFDAIYSIGALYYNKAAEMTKELNALADDYSREGIKKYEAKRNEVFAEFDKALPYFKDCEKIDPNDVNTLIALKEIFAKKDDLETSNEFKKRLEVVQDGGKNDKSYFK